jgi:glucose/arabinose dehydrogenase
MNWNQQFKLSSIPEVNMENRMRSLARLFCGAMAIIVAAGGANAASGQATTAGSLGVQEKACHCSSLPKLVDGYHIEVYAHVDQPMKLSFSRDGTLYVGREGGNDRIHKVGPGRHPVTEFGPPQTDPDAVLADDDGRISGHRHSVLVGGGGILAAIYRNQQSAVIFNNAGFADVDDMKFDRNGRLLFADDAPLVWASTGGPPSVLFSTPYRASSLAIDEENRIFIALADGTIRVYHQNGKPAGIFASGLITGLDLYLAFGDGRGGFGRFLYALSGGTLLRFAPNGRATVIGTGFSIGPASGTGMVFGPDHALYLSDYVGNRILRISRGNGH